MKKIIATLLMGLAPMLFAASGGQFNLDWNTIDGGGNTVFSGGSFSGGGTIGQPDAGLLGGGNFSLGGGFWYVWDIRANFVSGPTATPNPANVGDTIQFSVTGSNSDLTYLWDFGDGSGGAGASVTHTYTSPQNFTATVTAKHQNGETKQSSLTVVVHAAGSVSPGLQITNLVAEPSAGRPGIPVQLTADVSNPDNLPLTYSWDFGDGSAFDTTNPASHLYSTTVDTTFTVKLTVDNGVETAQSTIAVQAFAPPPPEAQGVPNVSQGAPAVNNPLNGLEVSVASSDGGIIELSIDINALIRSAFSVSTDFDAIGGRISTQTGTRPVVKFTEPQISVATVTATENTTGLQKGKARKTLAVSERETGGTPKTKAPPASTAVTMKSVKGSFIFGRTGAAIIGRTDSVNFKGSIELPEGLDMSQSQDVHVAIGNIIDKTSIDTKGKGAKTSTLGRVKKISVKYPKVAKGTTQTTAGLKASIDVTLSMQNMSANGFDTEGVAGTATDVDAKGAASRKIQMAVLIGGVAYEAQVPVQFKLSKDKSAGQITGRGAR